MDIKSSMVQAEEVIATKVDHIGVAVKNLDKSLDKWEELFGVKTIHIETLEEHFVRLAFIPVGGVLMELLEPTEPGAGIIAEFLEKHGEGFHHIAYRVEDLEALLAAMKKKGIRLMDEKPRPGDKGSLIAFLIPDETNNVLIELIERKEEII